VKSQDYIAKPPKPLDRLGREINIGDMVHLLDNTMDGGYPVSDGRSTRAEQCGINPKDEYKVIGSNWGDGCWLIEVEYFGRHPDFDELSSSIDEFSHDCVLAHPCVFTKYLDYKGLTTEYKQFKKLEII
jgi:hypothetical protein